MIKRVSDINFISKAKQHINGSSKKKPNNDNNKFGDNTSGKETKSNSKLKPKTNVSISKNIKTANAKETVFILGDSMEKKVNGFLLTRNVNHKYLVKVRPFFFSQSKLHERSCESNATRFQPGAHHSTRWY